MRSIDHKKQETGADYPAHEKKTARSGRKKVLRIKREIASTAEERAVNLREGKDWKGQVDIKKKEIKRREKRKERPKGEACLIRTKSTKKAVAFETTTRKRRAEGSVTIGGYQIITKAGQEKRNRGTSSSIN